MMAEDWKPGDLARCVAVTLDDSPPSWSPGIDGPVIGLFYEVVATQYDRLKFGDGCHYPAGIWLKFRHWPQEWFHAACFRKVRPIKADDFDREVIEALRGAPVETAA